MENSSGSLVYPQLKIEPRLFDSDERGCVRGRRRREDEMDADRTAVTVRNLPYAGEFFWMDNWLAYVETRVLSRRRRDDWGSCLRM